MSRMTRDSRRIAPPLTEWWEQYEGKQTGGNGHRVRAFVRSFAPGPGRHDRQRRLVEGLQSASDNGLIKAGGTTVVGKGLCCCEDCRSLTEAEGLLESITELREWEFKNITASGFSTRRVDSSVTGERHRVIVPPEVVFGIYVDGSLAGVFPCEDGSETYQPESYLDELLDIRLEKSTEGTATNIS